MPPELGGRYALDDDTNDWRLRVWLQEHPDPNTQAPILEFFLGLCGHPRPEEGEGSDVIWTPVEDGFRAVGVSWRVDRSRRLIRVTDVSDRPSDKSVE